jgi:hypothetical protein
MSKKLTLKSLYSGVVISFCLTFICFLPVTVPLLARFGAPILLTEQDATLLLRIFLLLSAVGFIWSHFLRPNLPYMGTGLISLVLIFVGHEVIVSALLFYLGVAGLVASSLFKIR